MLRTHWTPEAIDDVLAGTFPASDPPAWTPGMARPAPVGAADVVDVSLPTDSERTLGHGLASLLAAGGVALLVPVAILALGTPVALAVRGLLEAARWFLAIVR